MVDSNGNLILIRYQTGINSAWENSSGRISEIEDVRAVQSGSVYRTYTFSYNADAVPHLTSITNHIGTAESYTFSYQDQTIYSPFSPPVWYGSTTILNSVTVSGLNLAHTFEYGSAGGRVDEGDAAVRGMAALELHRLDLQRQPDTAGSEYAVSEEVAVQRGDIAQSFPGSRGRAEDVSRVGIAGSGRANVIEGVVFWAVAAGKPADRDGDDV
jgi:hypothetical protein